MTDIEKFLVGVSIALTIMFGLTYAWLCHEESELNGARNQIALYQNQVSELHAQSVAQEKRMVDAKSQADAQLKDLQNKTVTIMQAKVPHDCLKAIAWGINEAKLL